MFNWDLYVLDPFFILLGIFFLALLFRNEKEQKGHLLFYVETLLIWIVNFIIVKNFYNKLDNAYQLSSTTMIILSFFASSTLLTIILKPLATWITGRLHHRRIWMWAGVATTLTAVMVSHFYAQSMPNVLVFAILGVLIAFSMASQSLYYLYTNEQFYYRMFPVFTSIKVGSLIALASFIGAFGFTLNHTVQGHYFPVPNFNGHYLFGVCYVLLAVSFGLTFYKKEAPRYVKSFEPDLIKIFKPYQTKILIYLMLLALFWGMMYGLINSKVLDFFFVARLRSANYSVQGIASLLSLMNSFYFVPTFVFGYFFYNYVYKHLDTFQTTFFLFLMMALASVLAAFTRSWIVILLVNLLFGLALSQMFYLLFGFAMMWNYRTSVPVTGFVASGALTGTFIVEVTVFILRTLRAGIFSDFMSVGEIAEAPDLSGYVWMTNGSASIIFACLFVMSLMYMLTALISFKTVAAESLNLMSTINKMEVVDRKVMLDKLKSKIEL